MKVKFVPQNIEIEIKPNESVLHAAQSNGVHIQSICKGVPSCTECRVRVVDGDFNVFPPNQKEITLIGNSYFVDHRRLSCQLKCFGDITVDISEQVEKAEQAAASKRPRGARSEYDAATSQAKHGNIIFEGDTAVDGAIVTTELESDVPADERMVEYESNLKRAEKELFAEDTKRQLQSLKGGGPASGNGGQPRGSHDGSRPQGSGQNQNRNQNRNQDQDRNQDQNRSQGRNQNRKQNQNQNQNRSLNPNQGQSRDANAQPGRDANAQQGQGRGANAQQGRGQDRRSKANGPRSQADLAGPRPSGPEPRNSESVNSRDPQGGSENDRSTAGTAQPNPGRGPKPR